MSSGPAATGIARGLADYQGVDVDNRTPQERFWIKVKKTDTCWLWQASLIPAGYGSFSVNNVTIRAHRWAWEELVGPIPPGMVLDHQCHNDDPDCPGGPCIHRSCVNPAHMRCTTHGENVRASRLTLVSKALAKTHCPAGHPYDAEHTAYDKGSRYCRTCRHEREVRNRDRYNAARRLAYAARHATASV